MEVGNVKNKGTKNLKTRIEEIEFEIKLVREKLKMIEEFNLKTTDILGTYKLFFDKICEILNKLDEIP